MNRVSVLLPCFRPNISHLREALECLLSQTFTNWNLHILNQPWDVNVHEGIADLIADSRITFVQSKILRNIGENWNAVVQYATGDYVQFMFHDDLWSPEYLSRCVAALDSHPDVGFSSACHEYQFEGQAAGREYFDWVKAESDRTPAGRQPGKEFLLKWLRRGLTPNLIGEPPFVMMRRTVMQRAGAFSETLPQALDYEYWARLLCSVDFVRVPESLGAFRVHGMANTAVNTRSGRGRRDHMHILLQLTHSNDRRVAWAARAAVARNLPRMAWTAARDTFRTPWASGQST